MHTLTFLIAMILHFECGCSFSNILLTYIIWNVLLFVFVSAYYYAGVFWDWRHK
jgi:hypothetical protein